MNCNILLKLSIIVIFSFILQIRTKPLLAHFTYVPKLGECNNDEDWEYNAPEPKSNSMSWYMNEDKKFYVFGGLGYNENDEVLFNDLWIFDTFSENWIMKKPASEPDYDGPDFYPAARKSGATWLDKESERLYLFGGEGGDTDVGMLNDLWYYSIVDDRWVLVSGTIEINNKGDYTSENKYPGARSNALSWFDKESKKAYLFGGLGYGESTYGILNDLWTYSVDNGEWECIGGCGVVNSLGNYGVKNVSSESNYPGARHSSTSWYIEQDKTFYMFGGIGYNYEKKGILNDLWSYSVENDIWTWISGSNKTDSIGKYSILGKPSKYVYPGARFSSIPMLNYIDYSYRFIHLFGGGKSEVEDELFNDIWTYSIDEDTWTWVDGKNLTNINGEYVCYNSYPGSRRSSVSANANEIYIYGGTGYTEESTSSFTNEVWRLFISVPPEIPIELPTYIRNCYGEGCTLDHVLEVTVEIDVDLNLEITKSATIYVMSDIHIFVNTRDNPIEINGGSVIFDFNKMPEKFDEFLQKAREGENEFILINGKYIGSFDEIKVIPPSNYSSCETFIAQQKLNSDKYSAIFTINSDKCGPESKLTSNEKLTWWVILLIVIGIVFVLALVFLIIIFSNSKLRRRFLPFNRSNYRFESKVPQN